uniref:LSM domain-containing protein n=1 Tax=Anopheles maculatus TaxID=74869 RepID=A0A182S9K8_9DIPT
MEMSRKEKYNTVNYLTGVAQCLIRKNTLIDLQNETSVAGKIVAVDGYVSECTLHRLCIMQGWDGCSGFRFMNVTMENVVYIDQLGRQYLLDNFVIYSKYIRYIHIPKEQLQEQFTKHTCTKKLQTVEIR